MVELDRQILLVLTVVHVQDAGIWQAYQFTGILDTYGSKDQGAGLSALFGYSRCRKDQEEQGFTGIPEEG